MKLSLQASPRSWESTVSQREEVSRKLGSREDSPQSKNLPAVYTGGRRDERG